MSLSRKNIETCHISSNELLLAKEVITSFNAAYKYYSLYPAGHAYSRNCLARLKKELDIFLGEHKKLRIDIHKSNFFYKGETVLAGDVEDNNSAYLLSRDRILFIEFSEHIEPSEITTLFDIFNKHRNPLEEADGDIATTLWHFKFPHISYEAADIFAMEAIDFELSMFKAAPRAGDDIADHDNGSGPPGREQGAETAGGSGAVYRQARTNGYGAGEDGSGAIEGEPAKNVLMLAKDSDLRSLTPDEQRTLQRYIHEEEIRNNAHDVIDILLIVLAVESNEIDFATDLEYLEFEFFDALVREDYFLSYKICRNVSNICQTIRPKKPWAEALVNLFFTAISKEERFHELPCVAGYRDHLADPESLKYFWQVMELLAAEIMFTLAALAAMTPIEHLHLRNRIIDIISSKAQGNPVTFGTLLEQSGEEINLLLFPILSRISEKDANGVYLKMTRHPSPKVRRVGIDGFFQTPNTAKTEELNHLLRDNDKMLRERVLSYLGQTEGRFRDSLLIDYLGADGRTIDDEEHIIQCYKLLSRSPSHESIDFLREVLLESRLTSIINTIDKTHKTCAACALKSLGTKEGREILYKGAESMRPDVRHVCRKVLGQ